jgi:predicted aconitase
MQLTDTEKEMLDEKAGEAVRIAMSILTDIGDAVEAEEMTEIVHIHTDSGFYPDLLFKFSAINSSPFSMIAELSSFGVKSSINVLVYRLK